MECKPFRSMKKSAFIIICLLAIGSCNKPFEENWQVLRLDYEALNLPADKDKTSINIYYSGAWTAELTDNDGWISISNSSGTGVGRLEFLFSKNAGLSRAATLTVKGGGETKIVPVKQNAGIANPRLEFSQRSNTYPNGTYRIVLPIDSNIPSEFFSKALISAKNNGFQADWVSDMVLEKKEEPVPEDKMVQFPTGVRRYLSAIVESNESGAPREAYLLVLLKDAAGVEYRDSIKLSQAPDPAFLTCQAKDIANKTGGARSIPLNTNLISLLQDVKISVSYPNPDVTGFVSNERIEGSSLKYDLSENTIGAIRHATIELSYTDLAGVKTKVEPALSIEQTLFSGSFADIEFTTAAELLAWNASYSDWKATDHIRLGADIDLQGEEWSGHDFVGSFDGQGHKIYNYRISGDSEAGFFSSICGSATVSNLVLGSSDGSTYDGSSFVRISASSSARKRAGGLAAVIKDQASVSDVVNYATIKFAEGLSGGDVEVGGIAASIPTAVTISNCRNYGSISLSGGLFASIYTGGIVGNAIAPVILDKCENHGNILNASTCTAAYSNNTASGSSMTAGILGICSAAAKLSGCSNDGRVENTSNSVYISVGGLIGLNKSVAASMSGCINRGYIGCTPENNNANQLIRLGGFVAHSLIAGTKMENCENYGDVELNNGYSIYRNWLGGGCGYCKAVFITNCKFKSNLSRGTVAAGKIAVIVGQDDTNGGVVENNGVAGILNGLILDADNFDNPLTNLVGLKTGAYTTDLGSSSNYFLSE